MANESGHGGYRQPSTPAAVSGPGVHSRRTDGAPKMDLPDAKYGEAQAFDQIQSGAQLGGGPTSPGAAPQQTVAPPIGLGAPSQNPGQPVTAGAALGAGPGMDALGLPPESGSNADLARRYGPLLPFLIAKADSQYSSQEFRDQVRWLIAQIT